MKVYTKVTLDCDGNILYEDSYEYQGQVALCKKGQLKAARETEYAVIRAQQEQEKALRLQKQKADELKKGLDAESVKAAMDKERLLALKRQGQQSTIKTMERRPRFETFRAQFKEKYPLELLKEKSTQKLEREAMSSADPGFAGIFKKIFEIKKGTGLEDKKTKSKNEMLEARYDRLIRQEFGKESPLKRLVLHPATIKKQRLRASG